MPVYRLAEKYKAASARAPDRYLNFAIVCAPIDEVTEATVGIIRACENGAFLRKGDTTPPIVHASHQNGSMMFRKHVLVSRPIGANFALVEFNHCHDLRRALSLMIPNADVIGFRSNAETTKRWFEEFSVHRNGVETRKVEVDREFREAKTTWMCEGTPHPCENLAHYDTKVISKRLSRPILLEYASRCGLNLEQALFGRDLNHTTYIKGAFSLDDMLVQPGRIAKHQKAHDQAVKLGIGPGEDPKEVYEEQNAHMHNLEQNRVFEERVHNALYRAHPDPVKIRKAYNKWMSAPERPGNFKVRGSFLVSGIDRKGNPDAVAYLDAQAALWEAAQTWDFRITQTIVEQIDNVETGLLQISYVIPRAVMGVNDETYSDIETAMRTEMARVFEEIGIQFDPKGAILSEDRCHQKCLRSDDRNGISGRQFE